MIEPYYDEDGITIYHGDAAAVLPELPPVDLLLTDPPYGVGLGNHADARETRAGVGLKKQAYASYDDTHENFVGQVVPIVAAALAMSARGMVFCAGTNMWDFPRPDCVSAVFLPAGQGRTCWGFQNFAHFLLYGTAPGLQHGAKNIGLRSTDRAQPNGHPCPKPVSWMKWAVELGSSPTDLVLDPFMGSGTTLVAAKQLGRRAIGIELDRDYCDIAIDRLAQRSLFSVVAEAHEQG